LICIERINADVKDKQRYFELLKEISDDIYLCGWRIPFIKKDVFMLIKK